MVKVFTHKNNLMIAKKGHFKRLTRELLRLNFNLQFTGLSIGRWAC